LKFDVDILPAEGFSYVLAHPGVFHVIKGFSYERVLALEFDDDGTDNLKVSLVRTGIFDTFGEEMSAELPRDYVTRNAVSQAEALDGPRSFVGTHVFKIIKSDSGNRFWMYGTISDCEWDEQEAMAIYYLATAEDDLFIPMMCPGRVWLVLDM
jgi:hypothetical protein